MNNYSWNPLFCQRFSMPFPFLIYEKDRPSHQLIIHHLKSLQFGNLISTFLRKMLPFMSLISEHIEDFPHNPVDKHRHPNCNQAKVTNIIVYISKHDSKSPHGKNSNTHRPDYIACCPQCIRNAKRRHPKKCTCNRMDPYNLNRQLSCIRSEIEKGYQYRS